MLAVNAQQVSASDRYRLLRKIDGLDAQLEDLYAAGAVEPFEAKLHEYEALIDRMKASPLWPDTVTALREQVTGSISHRLQGYAAGGAD